jgi:protein O-GlcNAc transferase
MLRGRNTAPEISMARYPFAPRRQPAKTLKRESDPFFARLAEVRFLGAKTLQQQGRAEEAEAIYRELIAAFRRLQLNPSNLYASLGFTQLNRRHFSECEESLKLSLKHNPDQLEAHINLAALYQITDRRPDCEAACQRALRINPSEVKALCTLGTLRQNQRRYGESVQSYLLALVSEPDNLEAIKGLAGAYISLGEPELSTALYRRLIAADPDSWPVRTHLLFGMQYDASIPNEQILAEHKEYGDIVRRVVGPPRSDFPNLRSLDRPLRVGYLSSDFTQHVVMCFVENAIAAHDRSRVNVCCISNTKNQDAVTERIKQSADIWIDIHEVDDEQALERISKHELDIVVDLVGHTSSNRLLLLGRRLAPVQALWCGYSNTTGLDVIDYIMVDNVISPPGEPHFFTEEPVRLPNSFLCFTPPADSPNIGPLPFEKNGYITFGCLNNPSKINQHLVSWWARLLQEVPDSKFLLRYMLYDDPLVAARVEKMFRLAGVPETRYQIFGGGGGTNFRNTYNSLDIALDTFPYNGTTTTCEALWMGVPVVTLYGDRFAARVGASLLTYSGLGGMIATNPTEYVQQAAMLASRPELLARFRREFRTHLATTPVFDYRQFTSGLEKAYYQMFAGWCAGSERQLVTLPIQPLEVCLSK